MDCEECGSEMLVVFLGCFRTDYECPVCGHRQTIGALLDDQGETVIDDEPPTDEQVSYARLQKQLHDEGYAAPGPDDDDDDDGYDAPAYEDDSPAR